MKNIKDIPLVAIMMILLVGSFFLGQYSQTANSSRPIVVNGQSNQISSIDFAPFWRAWELLDERFVGTSASSTKPITDDNKLWGAISGLTDAYNDPYTVFLPPEEAKLFEGDISGNFEGIGAEIGIRDKILTVIAPLKGTPAERAGVRAGDKIVAIDGITTFNISVDEAIQKIRGKKGTTVELSVIRDSAEDPIVISVTRDTINIPTIDTKLIGNEVFVISVYNFSAMAPNLFRDALREFLKSRADKLVLDLRGNPGGYLEAAIDMASWFLPPGKTIVREDFGNNQPEEIHKSKGYNIFGEGLKMAVLVDGGSASASEILAGALKEQGVATVVGMQTFGKGSVQELIPLTNDTSLKITIARWLTPNGVSISEQGLTPDVVVPLTADDANKGLDPQLDKAVELLKQMK